MLLPGLVSSAAACRLARRLMTACEMSAGGGVGGGGGRAAGAAGATSAHAAAAGAAAEQAGRRDRGTSWATLAAGAGVAAGAAAAAGAPDTASCAVSLDAIKREMNFTYELRLRQSSDPTKTFEYFANYVDDEGVYVATPLDVVCAVVPVLQSSEALPGDRLGSREGEMAKKDLSTALAKGEIAPFRPRLANDTNNALFRLTGDDPKVHPAPLLSYEDFEVVLMLLCVPHAQLDAFFKLFSDDGHPDILSDSNLIDLVLMLREHAGLHIAPGSTESLIHRVTKASGVTQARAQRKDMRIFRQGTKGENGGIGENSQHEDSNVEKLVKILHRTCAADGRWRGGNAEHGRVSSAKVKQFVMDVRREFVWALWLHYDRNADGKLRGVDFVRCIAAATRMGEVHETMDRVLNVQKRVPDIANMWFTFQDLEALLSLRRELRNFAKLLDLLELRDRARKDILNRSSSILNGTGYDSHDYLWQQPAHLAAIVKNVYNVSVRPEVISLCYAVFCEDCVMPSLEMIRKMCNVLGRRFFVGEWTNH